MRLLDLAALRRFADFTCAFTDTTNLVHIHMLYRPSTTSDFVSSTTHIMQFSFCANSYSLKLHEPYATSDVSLFEFVMREKQFLYISYTYVLTLFVLMTRPKIPVHTYIHNVLLHILKAFCTFLLVSMVHLTSFSICSNPTRRFNLRRLDIQITTVDTKTMLRHIQTHCLHPNHSTGTIEVIREQYQYISTNHIDTSPVRNRIFTGLNCLARNLFPGETQPHILTQTP